MTENLLGHTFSPAQIEHLARMLGDCFNGSTISNILTQLDIIDNSDESTKWRRLNYIFGSLQKRDASFDSVLNCVNEFLLYASLDDNDSYSQLLTKVSRIILKSGIKIEADGRILTGVESTITSEAEKVFPQKRSTADATEDEFVFISYSRDSVDQCWLSKLVASLECNRVTVKTDKNLPLGAHLATFMERMVSNSQKVIVICNEDYKAKADERKSGVGFESGIISGALANDWDSTKFIPILYSGA